MARQRIGDCSVLRARNFVRKALEAGRAVRVQKYVENLCGRIAPVPAYAFKEVGGLGDKEAPVG